MFSLKLLLVFVVVIGATATPIQLPLVADNKGTVTCEKVDGYTTEVRIHSNSHFPNSPTT
jgi:hypothetical protein